MSDFFNQFHELRLRAKADGRVADLWHVGPWADREILYQSKDPEPYSRPSNRTLFGIPVHVDPNIHRSTVILKSGKDVVGTIILDEREEE